MASLSPALPIFLASIVLLALKPVLLHVAQGAGTERLDSRLFFLGAELLKILICITALAWRRFSIGPEGAKLWKGIRHTIAFSLPAGVYLVMNCSTVYANSILTPATFQLTVNIKIMTTAVAGWLVLARPLSTQRWVALALLTLSTMLGQASGGSRHHGGDLMGEASVWGFLVVLGPCAGLSALGAVLTERLLKSKDNSELTIFATNVHMSSHTLLLNAFAFLMTSDSEIKWPSQQLWWAVAVAVINEAANGILLSSIMRLADSNVKNYAFSVSVFVVVGFSALISDDYWPNPSFFIGAVLVIISMALYTRTGEKKA